MQCLNVHNLPQHVAEDELADSAVVVIDLLRATTTICHALASGATEVVPFVEINDALAAAARSDRRQFVLGGERKGGRIEGFDLGNSPAEYTSAAVEGRRVLITTTNGTRALARARLARRVFVGAIVNLSAVVRSIRDEPRINILCAGTDGQESREDILAAGAFVHQLQELPTYEWQTNDAADAARREWETIIAAARSTNRTLSEQLAVELRHTPGGRNLLGIGLDVDLVDCARIDRFNVVPTLDVGAWRIRLS